jgi:ABC-type transporter MlaC component
MKSAILAITFIIAGFLSCHSQTPKSTPGGMAVAADQFVQSLNASQKAKAQFSFDDDERFNWHYIPKQRNGIMLKELSTAQLKNAMALLRTGLSDTGYARASSIIELETVLKEVEARPATDDYRDRGKYCFSIFGNPASDSIWGWRLEGHHISLNFSSANNRIVSGTPGFMGTNPAIVLSGPEKGKYIMKDEAEMGLVLIKSLDEAQQKKAIVNTKAPGEILTANSRKAMINEQVGILYSELTPAQQKTFMQVLSLYLHRYTKAYAMKMVKDLETAGFNKLRFAWAGELQTGVGHPHYYRIQGPTIIIEYDNTQNNANHIHTVVRDLKNDFGGDELLEHYKQHKHRK